VRTRSKQLPFALGRRLNVELVLGVVFILSTAVAVIFVLSGKYPTAFWVSSVIALGSLALSKQRLAWVGRAVAYLSVPLAPEALMKLARLITSFPHQRRNRGPGR
jgi:hypothetical protein